MTAFRPVGVGVQPTCGTWFTCRHCEVTFVGALVGLTVRDEAAACDAHETNCPGRATTAVELGVLR